MALFGLEPSLVLDIGAVEFEPSGYLGTQFLGREDDHLVLHLAAAAHELHALEQIGSGTGTVVLLCHEYHRIHIIDAVGDPHVVVGQAQARDE